MTKATDSYRPTVSELTRVLPLIPRGKVIAHEGGLTQPGADAVGTSTEVDAREATYPARLALMAVACAQTITASARRAGVPGRRVLDLACGPAVVSRLLLEVGALEVMAGDRDPLMLAAANALHAHTPGLTVARVDALETLPFDDDAFQVVWVGDFWSAAMLGEVRRVLQPGGVLVLRLTRNFQWIPADPGDPMFRARIEAAVTAGLERWLAQQDVWREPVPEGEMPGWECADFWTEDLSWTSPVPEPVEELVLQDLACFHGRFAAECASEADWRRLCELADPSSPDYFLRRSDAQVRLGFGYQVYS